MSKKRPSSEELRKTLFEGHFAAPTELPPPGDPITPTQMVLDLGRIKPYDRNPRKERNPKYDEIKASIRAQDHNSILLEITRRPGEERYMVAAGGNTRLQILKELLAETGEERFQRVLCMYQPWVSETHVLAAHLIENDKRGDLIFIDRALAVRDLRRMLEAEAGGKLTQIQLAGALKAQGYGLDQSMISRMDYAVDVLLPLIPVALRSGMGIDQIRRIRRLETAARRFWDDHARDAAEGAFDTLFSDALGLYDGPGWDFDPFQQELEAGLSRELAIPLNQVRLELDARLAGATPPPPQVSGDKGVPSQADASPSMAPSAPPPPSDAGIGADTPPNPAQQVTEDSGWADSAAGTAAAPEPRPPAPPDLSGAPGLPDDLKSLRARTYVLALKIAKRWGLEDLVVPLPKAGYGYYLEMPARALPPPSMELENNNTEEYLRLDTRRWVYWHLYTLACLAGSEQSLDHLPKDSLLLLWARARAGRDRIIMAAGGMPDWLNVGACFWCSEVLDDVSMSDLLDLMRTARQIRLKAEGTEWD